MAAWCKFCDLEVPQNRWTFHIDSKKHKSKFNLSKMLDRERSKNESTGITVLDFNPELDLDTVVNYFKRFGKIVGALTQEDRKAVIQFYDWRTVQAILKRRHQIKGYAISVVPRKDPTEDSRGLSKPSQGDDVLQELEKTDMTIEDQIKLFVSRMESTGEDEAIRMKVCASFEQWLSFKYPGCRIIPFGSVTSGLALRGSDLDLCLDVPQDVVDEILKWVKPHQGVDPPNHHLSVLESISQTLRRHPDVNRLVVVRGARIPVTKFTHAPTGTSCDLSCVNKTGLQNSLLLRFLQSLDSRIKVYLLFIKYWSHTRRLKDFGLSSYALTLMAIYYLQQVTPSILPSIQIIQSQVPIEERIFINGWNVSFPSTAPAQSNGNASVFELVHQFFAYYAELDANDVVLCPLVGGSVPKRDFATDGERLLPDCMDLYYQNVEQGQKPFNCTSPLCVQDPFELNFNVTAHFKNWPQLQDKCRSVADLCSAMAFCQMPKRIRLLLTDSVVHLTEHEISCQLTPLSPLTPEQKSNFLDLISSAVVKFLQFSYLIDARALTETEASPAKKIRLEHSSPEEFLFWMFQVHFDFWSDRSKVRIPDDGNFMEKERAVTLRLAEHQGFNLSMEVKPLVQCKASISLSTRKKKNKNKHAICLKLENVNPSSTYHLNALASGLRYRWKTIVDLVVKENNLPFA